MTTQNYCMINQSTNICDNICLWDGNPVTWSPPAGYLMLVQATTPAKVWAWDPVNKIWFLQVVLGQGDIGFTWDGTYLTTNQPTPADPSQGDQPTVTGAQTL